MRRRSSPERGGGPSEGWWRGPSTRTGGRGAPSTGFAGPPPRSGEDQFLSTLRTLATHPAARGCLADAAVLEIGGERLVLTHDMIVEGVHFLPDDPPEDVAWKLVAVNLSDLAAKGAVPVGLLLGYALGDEAWNRRFLSGLSEVVAAFDAPLLGGDTVSGPSRVFGLTAIGRAAHQVPSRAGACSGDRLFVTGTIGDAGLGLRIARGEIDGPAALLARYRRPTPRLAKGVALVPLVTAMMDVSDGLLLDAARMAAASDVAIEIALDAVPLSRELLEIAPDTLATRLAASVAGDDYELLFAAPAAPMGIACTEVGSFSSGAGLRLSYAGEAVPIPDNLGYEHRNA